jgi:hypothetical protein
MLKFVSTTSTVRRSTLCSIALSLGVGCALVIDVDGYRFDPVSGVLDASSPVDESLGGSFSAYDAGTGFGGAHPPAAGGRSGIEGSSGEPAIGGGTGATSGGDLEQGGVGGASGSMNAGGTSGSTDGPCSLNEPFGAPVALNELNTPDEDSSMYLLPDELTAVFMSSRPQNAGLPTNYNIWMTTRASLADPFGAPVLMPGANQTGSYIYWVAITSDALTLYIDSDPAGGSHIYSTTRLNAENPFPVPSLVELNVGEYQGGPWIRADGGRLYFAATSTLGQPSDLYSAARSADGFATPQLVAGVNGTSGQYASVLSPDELTIYLSSARPGGSGRSDIWTAYRRTASDPFEPPTNVAEVNSIDDETPSWLSTDGCRLYLTSTRNGDSASDLYVAAKPQK